MKKKVAFFRAFLVGLNKEKTLDFSSGFYI